MKVNTPDALFKIKIAQMDKKYLDPGERANLVMEYLSKNLGIDLESGIIENQDFYDLICFSYEILSAYAVGTDDIFLTHLMKGVSQHLYSLHYSMEVGSSPLGLDRESHTKLWKDRIEEKKDGD